MVKLVGELVFFVWFCRKELLCFNLFNVMILVIRIKVWFEIRLCGNFGRYWLLMCLFFIKVILVEIWFQLWIMSLQFGICFSRDSVSNRFSLVKINRFFIEIELIVRMNFKRSEWFKFLGNVLKFREWWQLFSKIRMKWRMLSFSKELRIEFGSVLSWINLVMI